MTTTTTNTQKTKPVHTYAVKLSNGLTFKCAEGGRVLGLLNDKVNWRYVEYLVCNDLIVILPIGNKGDIIMPPKDNPNAPVPYLQTVTLIRVVEISMTTDLTATED